MVFKNITFYLKSLKKTQNIIGTYNAFCFGQSIQVQIDYNISIDILDINVNILAKHFLDFSFDQLHSFTTQIFRGFFHFAVDIIQISGNGLIDNLWNQV